METHILAVYLDLSKAFNILSHSILSDKLKVYGFRETPINLIKQSLSIRKQCVEIDCFRSSFHRGSTRVNVRALVVYHLYDYLSNASRLFKCIIYADDTTLIANLNDFMLNMILS